ncbi:MAG TPA: repressor LexA [Planctomycetaceae bacterium]|nr:repressor LexA [Planctomycetaceae bacterium]
MAAERRSRGRPPVPDLTEPQRKALQTLRDFIAQRKFPPTMSELGERLGVTAASAHQLVGQLEQKGYVTREPRKARSLSVVREPEHRPEQLVSVPLVGTVAAGPALLAEDNHIGDVLVDRSIAGRGRCFALRINGDSMTGAGMRNGDVVIVRQQPVAESGEIVVALLDGEATTKRLWIQGDRIELRAENRRYKPIEIAADAEFRIVGKVVAIRSDGTK